MSIGSLNRRIEKLGSGNAEKLLAVLTAAGERALAWARGVGPYPHEPLSALPPNATRADARLWRRLAEARALVVHDECGPASPFRELCDAYQLSDADLLLAVNRAEQLAREAEHATRKAEQAAQPPHLEQVR